MGAVTNVLSSMVQAVAGGGGSAPAPATNGIGGVVNVAKAVATQTAAGQQNMAGSQNSKQAGTGAALSSSMQAGLNANHTLLNGPGGVDPEKLMLGRNTLLGG